MTTLTNNMRKSFASLSTSKGRRELRLFMAQGHKCVTDTIGHFDVEAIIATDRWLEANADIAGMHDTVIAAGAGDIRRITTLSCPPEVIGIYRIPDVTLPDPSDNLIVALDCVQDPGNLGTIMRVCDWMGVNSIVASADTVDVWSPKVVQSTMGAVSRVRVAYCNLAGFLENSGCKEIYGTFLDGENIYDAGLSPSGIIVMGNEGNGISEQVGRMVTRKITIPPFPAGSVTSESLNVAMATGIVLSEFRRRLR